MSAMNNCPEPQVSIVVWLKRCTILVCCMAVAVVVTRYGNPLTRRENYLHLIGAQTRREGRLHEQMYDFISDVNPCIEQLTQGVNMDNIQDVIRWIGADREPKQQYAQLGYPNILRGMDPWDQPFVFQIRTDDFGTELDVTGFIRSIGANGIDENGGGDDIEHSFARHTVDARKP